jgi:hypothetical protein
VAMLSGVLRSKRAIRTPYVRIDVASDNKGNKGRESRKV